MGSASVKEPDTKLADGIEPTTTGLQIRSSTIEPRQHDGRLSPRALHARSPTAFAHHSYSGPDDGFPRADGRSRTGSPLGTNQVLCHLSFVGMCERGESNPHATKDIRV